MYIYVIQIIIEQIKIFRKAKEKQMHENII
jgi:hypothetical protein